jgi:putative hydrolase of the HAD superfamily
VRSFDAVLFDFGGVFTLSPFGALADASAEWGADPTVIHDVLFGPYDRDTDHPWHRLERGELSLVDARAAIQQLAAAAGLELDPFDALSRLGRDDGQRPQIVERARTVKATGVRTACVTNNVAEFGNGWRAMIPVADLFDVIVDSSQSGVRKPDPAIFALALDALEVRADRAVFLDDFPGNIAAAEAVGLRAILVGPDRLAAFDVLDALLTEQASPGPSEER